jgi:hypothetical protein
VPALNERSSHAQCLADLLVQHCQGWTNALQERLANAARGTSA